MSLSFFKGSEKQANSRGGLGLFLAALVLFPVQSGCVIDRTGLSETALIEAEIRDTQERVASLERNVSKEISSTVQELTTVRKGSHQTAVSQANADAVLQEILEQNAGVRGSLESIQARVADLEDGEERIQENLAFQIEAFQLRLSNVESGASASTSSSASAPVISKDGPLGEADAFLNQGDGKAALKVLKGFDPQSEFEKEAKSLLSAAALYQDRQLKEAMSAYEGFLQTYPESRFQPEALLSYGTLLVELGSSEDGSFFLSELIRIYPDSAEAKKAQARLNAVK